MTDTEPDSTVKPLESLLEVSQVRTDATGVDTFARYVWQAKQAVRQWLTCFAGEAEYVLCEHVEDVAVIHVTGFRFMQLKTRDHGSWSAAILCDKGIKSLVRS
ncbi:dsDNA nuclease domain-containing protein [Micromonospora sp. NPDC005553]|uniref:dsDNA nuclease domain-containing protein n=1 Tax=Micromonospora sp. NPDC005553 TaxID=3364232 RepID=UPI0036C92DB2